MFYHRSFIAEIIKQKKLHHRVLAELNGTRQKGSAYKSQTSSAENTLGGVILLVGGAIFGLLAYSTGDLAFWGFAAIGVFIGYGLYNTGTTDNSSPTMLPGETFDAHLMQDRIQQEVYERMQRQGIEPAQD